MKTLATICLLATLSLVALSAFAGVGDSLPYHPFRKVGDRYYSLVPIYEWARLLQTPSNKLTEKQKSTPRPMPDWIGIKNQVNIPVDTNYRVKQVRSDGLIVEAQSHAYAIGTRGYKTILLLNYPYKEQVATDQTIQFLALKTGVRDAGIYGTVEVYDYGIPYDPAKLSRTNTAANTNQNKAN